MEFSNKELKLIKEAILIAQGTFKKLSIDQPSGEWLTKVADSDKLIEKLKEI